MSCGEKKFTVVTVDQDMIIFVNICNFVSTHRLVLQANTVYLVVSLL